MADRQGLKLVKSGRRDPRAIDFDKYMLIDQAMDGAVAGISPLGRAAFSLDQVEDYLTRERN